MSEIRKKYHRTKEILLLCSKCDFAKKYENKKESTRLFDGLTHSFGILKNENNVLKATVKTLMSTTIDDRRLLEADRILKLYSYEWHKKAGKYRKIDELVCVGVK